jgi:catechol 2,3-dioxygenase-like lactoylglutathione lyase family enzyme
VVRASRFFGWEVADASALDALCARLEEAGVSFARGSRALADERHVKDLIVFNDPLGTRVEIFHGGEIATNPFRPGRSISGFRTGPLGLGHVVMNVERLDEVVDFYETVLGFGLSDFYSKPFSGRFMHVNPRHHSLAFVQTGKLQFTK